MRERVTEHKHGGLTQLPATAICGNDITSSCLYVSALAIVYAGKWAWISLLIVAAVLFLYRRIYAEVVGAPAAQRRRLQRAAQYDEQVAGLDGGVPDHSVLHRHRRDLGQRGDALRARHLARAAGSAGHGSAAGRVHAADHRRHHGVVPGGGGHLSLPPRHAGRAAAGWRTVSAGQRVGGPVGELRAFRRAGTPGGALLRLLRRDARHLRVRELRQLRGGAGRGSLSQDSAQHVGRGERSQSDARPPGAGAGADSRRGAAPGGAAGAHGRHRGGRLARLADLGRRGSGAERSRAHRLRRRDRAGAADDPRPLPAAVPVEEQSAWHLSPHHRHVLLRLRVDTVHHGGSGSRPWPGSTRSRSCR